MNKRLGTSLFARIMFAGFLTVPLLVAPASFAQSSNTANGYYTLYHNTTGVDDTAYGFYALCYNTSGYENTAVGSGALFSNTTGNFNTANGVNALRFNVGGSYNTAAGYGALELNGPGSYNTATGYCALYLNNTGGENTAFGDYALYANTGGTFNVANGYRTLYANTNGSCNIATAYGALYNNTSGSGNVAEGYAALYSNTTGGDNVAIGTDAGFNSSGNANILLGAQAGYYLTTGSDNIAIGNRGAAADTGIIRIGTVGQQGQAFIAGINGVGVSGAVPVYINSSGQLGTVTSSQRFKYDIKDIGSKSDKLMDLRPVTFRYKEAADDGSHPLQYGLIAEEVAKVYPDLVQYDKQGKPFTVYYHLLTPMLLDQIQKEHQQLAAQQTEIISLKSLVQGQVSGTNSLQHTVQSLVIVAAGLVLVAMVCAALVVSRRGHSVHLPRNIETFAS